MQYATKTSYRQVRLDQDQNGIMPLISCHVTVDQVEGHEKYELQGDYIRTHTAQCRQSRVS